MYNMFCKHLELDDETRRQRAKVPEKIRARTDDTYII